MTTLIPVTEVDMTFSQFIGERRLRSTGKVKLCDVCGKAKAMWAHRLKGTEDGIVFVCFGCGGH